MPREAIGPQARHVEEQRRYREGLRVRRVPEVGRVDTALVAAVYSAMRSPEAVMDPAFRRAVKGLLDRAVSVLAAQEFDPAASRRVLARRLGLPNPRFDGLLSNAPSEARETPHGVGSR